jgi:hypothetical protein
VSALGVMWVACGWALAMAVVMLIAVLVIDPGSRREARRLKGARLRTTREVDPAPAPLTREETWALGLPWVSDAGELEWAPEGWTVDGPSTVVHANLHLRRSRAELDLPHVSGVIFLPVVRDLLRTLTDDDVIHLSGAWLLSDRLPGAAELVPLPSGRTLTGQELGNLIRWLRWREGEGDRR